MTPVKIQSDLVVSGGFSHAAILPVLIPLPEDVPERSR